MSVPDRETRASDASPAGAGTRALLSSSALRRNLPLARAAAGADDDAFAADAYGHGAAWVRDTLDLRGAEPLHPATLFGLPGGDPNARPVLTLTGRVLSTKALRAGEGVSYGYAHRAAVDTRIALVTGGYAQGVVRMLGGRASVRVGDRFLPVIGRIAMDVCVLDAGERDPERGAPVVYFGDPAVGDPSLAAWVHATGWSAAELVTTAGLRALREVRA
ncbi:alanine racemase C-terminal domain-containing protein [Microbacterium sp. NPDC091313]